MAGAAPTLINAYTRREVTRLLLHVTPWSQTLFIVASFT
jgi:hypothetical protein